MKKKWQLWIDTGGTFTDALALSPSDQLKRVKILSSSKIRGKITNSISADTFQISFPFLVEKDIFQGYNFKIKKNYSSRIVSFDVKKKEIKLSHPLADIKIPCEFEILSEEESPIMASRILTETPLKFSLPPLDIRLGSTKGTNALLERKGAPTILLITKGFQDLLEINTQQRPELFSLKIEKRKMLYKAVITVDERIDAKGKILIPLKSKEINRILKKLSQIEKINHFIEKPAIALVFMHSYLNPTHENTLKERLLKENYSFISNSTSLSRSIKILPRAETAVVNAYLSPVIHRYLNNVKNCITEGTLKVMNSAGGLIDSTLFHAKDSLLSGPSGGVVGAAYSAKLSEINKIITFDMGGTSTDVSLYNNDYTYHYELKVGDATLQSPSIAIETIAAGGGSICGFDGLKLYTDTESAGAQPGPACYGAGGPLTITDVNLLLGRLDVDSFSIPINKNEAQKALQQIIKKIPSKKENLLNEEEILRGFLQIINEKMAEAIRRISVEKGYDLNEYTLLAFGGAGGQHACNVAELLNMKQIMIPQDASLLSALGMGKAHIERFVSKQILKLLTQVEDDLSQLFQEMEKQVYDELKKEGFRDKEIFISRRLIYLRFQGQDSTLELLYEEKRNIFQSFKKQYEHIFGHWISHKPIEVESLKVIGRDIKENQLESYHKLPKYSPKPIKRLMNFCTNWQKIPVFDWNILNSGAVIQGPALITGKFTTIYLEENWLFHLDNYKNALLQYNINQVLKGKTSTNTSEEIQLSLFTNRFKMLTEQMGALLKATAFSVNIKERMDFSCALLDSKGYLIANAPHIPVHLGSLGICTRHLIDTLTIEEDDVIITNHPAYGGSHLPDITLISPVFVSNKCIAYLANRAHHAEIGGKTPGSMPPNASSLEEEGVIIHPTFFVKKGKVQWENIKKILKKSRYPSRLVEENIADLQAALAAIKIGKEVLTDLCEKYKTSNVLYYMNLLKDKVCQHLLSKLNKLPKKIFKAQEFLDDGSCLNVKIQYQNEQLIFDFSGSAPIHRGNLNANPAIVNSVVIYILRLLFSKDLPLNEGIMQNVNLILPKGMLNPSIFSTNEKYPAVVGGNTEVSQRLTDTLIKALELAACSQGTMNNLLFGNENFGYYETLGGGSGAGKGFNGVDAIHHHMTNTRITDPEILELRYSVRLDEFSILHGTGGKGKWQGGNGLKRKITFLESVYLTVLTQHRKEKPFGLAGGEFGKVGKQYIIRKTGERIPLNEIDSIKMNSGDTVVMKTPGGGGYGKTRDNFNNYKY